MFRASDCHLMSDKVYYTLLSENKILGRELKSLPRKLYTKLLPQIF